MDALYDCLFHGVLQVNTITKESNNKFNTLTVSLPVGMNPDADHDIEAIATAFGAQTLEAPLLINVTAAWHGYANPRLAVQSMTKFLNDAEIPENFPIPVGRICGVGKVLEINSTEGWLRIYTVSFDRVAGTRRSFELIAYRLPEARWKNTPQFPVNSTIFFSGELYSQQPTTKLFTIVLDDATWMVQTGGGNNTTPASATTTPTKKRRLGASKNVDKTVEKNGTTPTSTSTEATSA
ncbi:unnamed protein product [Tilletia controversa]|uniref:Uncharacterized protein n=4 Tax=Tilletia TaxID=13289 RepID=A0A8X7SSE1_9BASI|nr:hypothetical protein A4X06_0g9328 [Tilletia controversa]CAD6908941.1 unnamed protein product [Tilletia controversa]